MLSLPILQAYYEPLLSNTAMVLFSVLLIILILWLFKTKKAKPDIVGIMGLSVLFVVQMVYYAQFDNLIEDFGTTCFLYECLFLLIAFIGIYIDYKKHKNSTPIVLGFISILFCAFTPVFFWSQYLMYLMLPAVAFNRYSNVNYQKRLNDEKNLEQENVLAEQNRRFEEQSAVKRKNDEEARIANYQKKLNESYFLEKDGGEKPYSQEEIKGLLSKGDIKLNSKIKLGYETVDYKPLFSFEEFNQDFNEFL